MSHSHKAAHLWIEQEREVHLLPAVPPIGDTNNGAILHLCSHGVSAFRLRFARRHPYEQQVRQWAVEQFVTFHGCPVYGMIWGNDPVFVKWTKQPDTKLVLSGSHNTNDGLSALPSLTKSSEKPFHSFYLGGSADTADQLAQTQMMPFTEEKNPAVQL